MLENIGLMKGIGGKMDWLTQRQTILSQNIANSDTPDYRPRDLKEQDFGAVMRMEQSKPKLRQAATNEGHLGGSAELRAPKSVKSREVYEASIDGNAVVLEEQLLKAQATQSDYSLITNLYKKNVGMIKMVVAQ